MPETAPQPQPPIVEIRRRIAAAAESARSASARLLAVSKTRSADEVRALAEQSGQTAFGENYVQEASRKRAALADLDLEWHLIGHLQSNKCKEAAATFDWIESIDRSSVLAPLAKARTPKRGPLNLLIQVNIDAEDTKSGCRPDQMPGLAQAINGFSNLRLRGLMAIPAPDADLAARRPAFAAMTDLYQSLRRSHPQVDTLSMGMSEDFELALAAGATQVRIGTALFGPRAPKP